MDAAIRAFFYLGAIGLLIVAIVGGPILGNYDQGTFDLVLAYITFRTAEDL